MLSELRRLSRSIWPARHNYAGGDPVNNVDPQGLWAAGVSFDFAFIQPFTSGGGGIYLGLNLEYTSSAGLKLYTYSTPNDYVASSGFLVGPSVQLNVATGNGPWTGPFDSGGASLKFISGSYFHSPLEGPDVGYYGVSLGVGKGLPGVGLTRTEYTERWDPVAAFRRLIDRGNVSTTDSGEVTINTDTIKSVVVSERSVAVIFENGDVLLIDKDKSSLVAVTEVPLDVVPEQTP